MNNMFNIAWYTVVRNFRDTKTMLNTILLPFVLILILGSALGQAFEIKDLEKIKAGYVNLDKGLISEKFDELLSVDEIKNMLEIVPFDEEQQGIKSLREGNIPVLIVLEEGISDKVTQGKEAPIKLYGDKNKGFETSVARSIIDRFASGANTVYAMSALGSFSGETKTGNLIKEIPVSAKGKIPGAMDYYSVTMLVLFTLYGALYALHGMGEDYLESKRNRLLSTPVSLASHFTGKIAGTVFTVYMQSLLIIAFTKFVYGANWGKSIFDILFITLTLTVLSVSLGTMAAMLAKDRKIANSVVGIIIPVMTFISGGYYVTNIDQPLYQAIKLLLPSNLGHTAFFNSIYGDFAGQTVSSIAIMWVMIALMGTVSVIAGRRKLN